MHKTLTHGTGKSVYKSMAQSMLLNAFSNALQCVVEFSEFLNWGGSSSLFYNVLKTSYSWNVSMHSYISGQWKMWIPVCLESFLSWSISQVLLSQVSVMRNKACKESNGSLLTKKIPQSKEKQEDLETCRLGTAASAGRCSQMFEQKMPVGFPTSMLVVH